MGFETAALLLSWVAIGLLGLAMAGLMRQVRWLLAGSPSLDRIGPPLGSTAPALSGVDYAASRRTMVVFVTDDCPVCANLIPEAEKLGNEVAHDGTRVVIGRAGFDDAMPAPPTLRMITVQPEQLIAWRVSAMPFAVVVADDARVILAEPIGSADALRSMITDRRVPEEVAV